MSEETKYELVKFIDNELELEVSVSPKEETVWMSNSQLSVLFGVKENVINYHIKDIFKKQELVEESTTRKFRVVRIEGSRKVTRQIIYYNLDMIISIGYRVNSKRGIIFRKWANKVLREYLLKGYVINENRVTVSNENYIELRNEVASINNRLLKVEDKVLDKEYEINKIFYNGEFYDAYTLIQSLFEKATNEIIIIDNYIDRTILDRLVVKKKEVKVKIYTSINSKLIGRDINTFNNQYGLLEVIYTTKVHDRYIIIDRTKLYHLGHSIKDLGKKIFSISESDNDIIQDYQLNPFKLAMQDAVDKALEDRPDLKSNRMLSKVQEYSLKAIKRQYAPEITGDVSWGYTKNESTYTSPFQVGASMGLGSLNPVGIHYQVKEGEAMLDIANHNVNIAKTDIFWEVQANYINMRQLERKIPLMNEKVKATLENFELADGRYSVGLNNYVELQDALTNYNNSQLSFVQAVFEYNVARETLLKSMGAVK